MSLAFTVVVLLSGAVDPGIWLADYPPDIRAAVAGSVEASRTLVVVVSLALATILIGGPLASNWLLCREQEGRFNFAMSFVHTLALFWFLNVYDVVVIDWLIFTTIQPDFFVFPGTEGMAGYDDYFYHFRESFVNWTPWVGSLLLAGVIGLASVFISKVSGSMSREEKHERTL